MTDPTFPPVVPDSAARSFGAADQDSLPMPSSQQEDDDGDDSSSGSGEGGGQGGGQGGIKSPILDFSDRPDLSRDENDRAKLDKLGRAPMSSMAVGATAFASENDLTRRVFMTEIGLRNLEMRAQDLANPRLIELLDQKQAERRALFGIKTLDDMISGAASAAGAVIDFVSQSVTDYVKNKREDRKVSKIVQNFEQEHDAYALDSDDLDASKASLEEADFPVQIDQGAELGDVEVTLSRGFGVLAEEAATEENPQKKRKDDTSSSGKETQGPTQELNPMGG